MMTSGVRLSPTIPLIPDILTIKDMIFRLRSMNLTWENVVKHPQRIKVASQVHAAPRAVETLGRFDYVITTLSESVAMLTPDERRELLSVARNSIQEEMRRRHPAGSARPEGRTRRAADPKNHLDQPGGAFVTLHLGENSGGASGISNILVRCEVRWKRLHKELPLRTRALPP